jgi:hypothetical protein
MKHKYRGTSWQREFQIGTAAADLMMLTDRTVLYSLDRTVHHGFRIAQSNHHRHALSSMAAQPWLNDRDPTSD